MAQNPLAPAWDLTHRRRGIYNGIVDELTLLNQVTTTYLGDNRVSIAAGDRHFVADQRTCLDRPGAGFCPLEMVAAALGA